MAITIGNVTSAGGSGSSDAFSHNNDGEILVVTVGGTASGTINSITYNGVAMTLGVSQTTVTDKFTWIYYMLNAPSGANNLIASYSKAMHSDVTAYSISGADASPIGDSDTGASSGTASQSILNLTTEAGSLIIDNLVTAGTYTDQGAGQDIQRTRVVSTLATFVTTSKEDSAGGAETMEQNFSTTAGFGHAALEIKAPPVPPTYSSNFLMLF